MSNTNVPPFRIVLRGSSFIIYFKNGNRLTKTLQMNVEFNLYPDQMAYFDKTSGEMVEYDLEQVEKLEVQFYGNTVGEYHATKEILSYVL